MNRYSSPSAQADKGSRVAAIHMLDEPVFREPWEAQAFAMTVLLHQQGLFTWTEWAQALTAQVAADEPGPRVTEVAAPVNHAAVPQQRPEKSYYQHWLAALETLVASKGLSSPEELTRYQRAWANAAHRTPHGVSIDLLSEDIGG